MSRTPLICLSLAGLFVVSACSSTSTGGAAQASKLGFTPRLEATPGTDAADYGLNGTLTEEQLIALTHLAWPQNYDSLKDRFGFPAKRSDGADYYKTPGGQWVAIFYSGGSATGYSFSQSQ